MGGEKPNLAAGNSIKSMLKNGLIEEVDAKLGEPVWRETGDGHGVTLIATEAFLGVRPSRRYVFFVIASPVGGYGGEVFSPVRIWVEDKYVRAAVGGLGAVKSGANYVASLLAAEEAKARGYAQVLWTDAANHRYFEEVGTMNLVVRIGDEFVTPPLGGSIPWAGSRATRSSRCCAVGACPSASGRSPSTSCWRPTATARCARCSGAARPPSSRPWASSGGRGRPSR
jgi:hypothetical protein